MPDFRNPIISAIGIVSRDEYLLLDRHPEVGGYAIITGRMAAAGGTTGNIVTALARLGTQARLFATVGVDDWGRSVLESLRSAGVDTSGTVTAPGQTDLSIMLVSGQARDRTILWERGPTLKRGDRIDIDRLFTSDLTVIDVPDHELCRLLTDLPAHTYPKARLLGTLSYLAEVPMSDKLDVACRFDVLVGNEREYCLLTGRDDPDAAFQTVAGRMTGRNLRAVVMTRGARGAVAVNSTETVRVNALPCAVVDTTGAGDAFAAGVAYATALRWELDATMHFANAVASFAIGALGAQSSLPSLPEAVARAGLGKEYDRVARD